MINKVSPLQHEQNSSALASLSKEAAEVALQREVNNHCCFGKEAARDLTVERMDTTDCHYYKLETFTEVRTVKSGSQPWNINSIIMNRGPKPSVYDMPVRAPPHFVDSSYEAEIPNSSSVRPCISCAGSGSTRCSCYVLYGNTYGNYRCLICSGSGYKLCWSCSGLRGHRYYEVIRVDWKTHCSHFSTSNQINFPDKLFSEALGHVMIKETAARLTAVTTYPQHDINEASRLYLQAHEVLGNSGKILQQRHMIKIVPLSACDYRWKQDITGRFFVYGQDRRAYAPDYPQNCCCCRCDCCSYDYCM